MINISNKIKIIFLLALLSLFSILFTKSYYGFIKSYLSINEPVEANILVVEGWLQYKALEMSFIEFNRNGYDYIITTGMEYSHEYFNMSMDGYLIFYPENLQKKLEIKNEYLLAFDTYSQMKGEYSAHFNIIINDSLITSFYSEKKPKKYEIVWEESIEEIDSILIQFDNDAVGDWGDINLYVKEITIDDSIILPIDKNVVYEIPSLNKRFRIGAGSFAEGARNQLLRLGVDTSLVISVQSQKAKYNKTLNSALAFRDWISNSEFEIKGINIITSGTHARRTWLTYNKLLYNSYPIGIISIPDNGNYSKKVKIRKIIRELMAYIYYQMILLPY